jgi:hypothetical protein
MKRRTSLKHVKKRFLVACACIFAVELKTLTQIIQKRFGI